MLFKPALPEFLAILELHARLEGQAAGLAARRLSVRGAEALMGPHVQFDQGVAMDLLAALD